VKVATRVTVLSLTLGLAAVVGCARIFVPHVTIPEVPPDGDIDAPECPGPYFRIPPKKTLDGGEIPEKHTVEIAAGISHVPEFHDCQRFITKELPTFRMPVLSGITAGASVPPPTPGSTGATGIPVSAAQAEIMIGRFRALLRDTYGPLYAVFAARNLSTLTFQGDSAFAAAEVYTGRGTYGRLGIKPGFNCLYMSQEGGWRAWMIYAGDDDSICTRTLKPAELDQAAALPPEVATVKHLKVVRAPTKKAIDSIPGVTRWDRDTDGNYYITIKCAQGWCDVGLEDETKASPPLSVTSGMSAGEISVRTIKGFYDRQALAVSDGDGGVKTQPEIGVVIPDPHLETAKFNATDWTPVGTIELGQIPAYESKLSLKPGTNRLFMRGAGTKWEFKVVDRDGRNSKIYKVKRRGHEGENFKIPGVLRWRWSAKDETIWARCDLGCCEVQSGVG
jgi:hypothetical protein